MPEQKDKQATAAPISPEYRRRLQTLLATEAEWDARMRFQPYLAVQTEHSRPSQIFVVAMTGVEMWKKLRLPEDFADLDFPAQLRMAGQVAREHYLAKAGKCQYFGQITGYALARAFDDWIGLGVDGEMVQRSIPPVEWGKATLRCEGKVLFCNGAIIASPGPEDDPNWETPRFAPLPQDLHLLCAPAAASAQVAWSSVLLRHHFGPAAVISPAPGGSEDEFQQQVAQLVVGGGKVVVVGHGLTADLAVRQAKRHSLPILLFEPVLPGEMDEGRPLLVGITAQNTLVVHLIRPGAEASGLTADWLPSPWHRKYTPGRDPETGLPGLLRDLEEFLNQL